MNIKPCPRTVSIIGHRGAGGHAPENSLSAIRKGLELGCARIEVDVQQTADGVLVIMHDETINRTTNGKGKIRNLTSAELRHFTLKPFGNESTVEKIPLLKEVLETINGKAGLLIEIKHGNDYYPGIEKRVAAMIQQQNAESWCMVQSFKKDVLARIHDAAPGIKLHRLLLSSYFTDVESDKHISEVSVFKGLLTKKFIARMHNKGKLVNVWTVNNKKDMEYFISIGVDGIITDYPDLANEVLGDLSAKNKNLTQIL